jgi:hypothetical protein
MVLGTLLNWVHLKQYTDQNSCASEADLYNQTKQSSNFYIITTFRWSRHHGQTGRMLFCSKYL